MMFVTLWVISIFANANKTLTAMKQATTPEFAEYQKQGFNWIIKPASSIFTASDLHSPGDKERPALVDVRSAGLSGARAERLLELCSVACNMNTVPEDASALNPSGIRLGTLALTTRGLKEADMDRVVDYIDKALKLALEITKVSGSKLADFNRVIGENVDFKAKITNLKNQIETFSKDFPLPGYENY